MDEAENQINDRNIRKKNQPIRTTRKKNPKKNEATIDNLWDNFKRSNTCLIGVPEGEEKKQEIGNLSEKIVIENSPNLVKEIVVHVQEAQSPKYDGCKETHSKTHPN